jgi:hypothetical protein
LRADRIGVAQKWLQKSPKASGVHFDTTLDSHRDA